MSKVQEALMVARDAHKGQMRKLDGVEMIVHPIEVAEILGNAGFRDEVVMAGYLHDTVEDTDLTLSDIEHRFGKDVARIVAANTEDKSKSWEDRKLHTIKALEYATLEEKALVVADKLSNLRSLHRHVQLKGDTAFDVFKRGRSEQAWYFRGVMRSMYLGIPKKDVPAFFDEYAHLVYEVFTKNMKK